jgi:hypothetical protein
MQIVKMFAALLVTAGVMQTLATQARAEEPLRPRLQASFDSADVTAHGLIGCSSRRSNYHYGSRETYASRQKFRRTFKRGHGVGSR